jgi:hypothetical protein
VVMDDTLRLFSIFANRGLMGNRCSILGTAFLESMRIF